MENLKNKSSYKLSTEMREYIGNGFSSDTANKKEVEEIILSYFKKHNITLDPHTAVGVICGKNKLSEDILVTLSTAHPAKFKETVSEIISDNSFITDKVKSLDTLEEHMIIANKNANDIKKLIDNHVAESSFNIIFRNISHRLFEKIDDKFEFIHYLLQLAFYALIILFIYILECTLGNSI